MIPIKSALPYEDFISGRDVDDSTHYEDGTPGTVGWINVADMRIGDTGISEAELASIAAVMTAANALLPGLPVIITPSEQQALDLATLLAAGPGAWTEADQDSILELLIKRDLGI